MLHIMYIVYYKQHNVDGGWERSEPIELVYKKLPLSNVLAVQTHMKFSLRRRGRKRFRLTKQST